MDPYERTCLQLVSVIRRNEEKDKTNTFPYSSKTNSTLQEKKFIPLYAERLHFLVKRTWWLVTKSYEHYTSKQGKFQKEFVVMNQKSYQKATSPVERDFFKLLNNSNFGIDCRNNIDNCIIEPAYDDISEISYIKKFTSVYNNDEFRDSFSPRHMREDVMQTFQQKTLFLDKKDPTYEARKQYLNAIDSFEKSKNKRKRKLYHIDKKTEKFSDLRKTKMTLEFKNRESASIQMFAVTM